MSAQTSEDQEAIQQPDVAKDPGQVGRMSRVQKYTAGSIEENIDSVIVFKCSDRILKWVTPKHRRVCGRICRTTQIEVRVLLESDTCTVLVTAEIPKNL